MKKSIIIKLILAGALSLFIPMAIGIAKAQLLCAGDDHFLTLGNARLISNSEAAARRADYKTLAPGYLNLSARASQQYTDIWLNTFTSITDDSLVETNSENLKEILDKVFPEPAAIRMDEFQGFNFVLFTPALLRAAKPEPTQTESPQKQFSSQNCSDPGFDPSTAMVIGVFGLLGFPAGLTAPDLSSFVLAENDTFQQYPKSAQHALSDLPGKQEIFHPP